MCKKLTLFIPLVLSLMLIFSVTALAGSGFEEMQPVSFEITGGLLKESEVTFDEKRNVVGVAPKDTEIRIIVSVLVEDEDAKEQSYEEAGSYNVSVGSSGMFTQSVVFPLGESVIEITACSGESETVSKTFYIKRKSAEIKRELERNMVLPASKIIPKGETDEK